MTAAALHTVADLETVVARELSPLVRKIDEEGFYPEAVMRSLGAAGAFGRHADAGAADAGACGCGAGTTCGVGVSTSGKVCDSSSCCAEAISSACALDL